MGFDRRCGFPQTWRLRGWARWERKREFDHKDLETEKKAVKLCKVGYEESY